MPGENNVSSPKATARLAGVLYHLKVIAKQVGAGRLNLETLGAQGVDNAHQRLTSLHGVGPWTADVYLLICLGHSDAWPAGDVGSQDGIRFGLKLESRPTTREMISLAECWRPFRGAAAHLWWAYNRAARRAGGSAAATGERAIAGKTAGLLDPGDEVTWRGRHFAVCRFGAGPPPPGAVATARSRCYVRCSMNPAFGRLRFTFRSHGADSDLQRM